MKLTVTSAALIVVLAVTAPLAAQNACPCVPLSHQWVVTPCESWNCAAAATIMANGDKYVVPVPTNNEDFRWLIVKRIPSGASTISPDAPFRIETFDNAGEAAARFASIDRSLTPILMTVPDGQFVVVTRTSAETRRRSAGR